MIDGLARARALETSILSPPAAQAAQLQKLVVNAIINPLTALFRCQNRVVLENATLFALLKRLVVEETGPIVRAIIDKGVDSDDNNDFSDQRLLDRVVSVANKTGENTSSMLQDAQAGRRTEIDYINGHVVAQAERLGLPHGLNAMLVRLVREQRVVNVDDQGELDMLFPLRN